MEWTGGLVDNALDLLLSALRERAELSTEGP